MSKKHMSEIFSNSGFGEELDSEGNIKILDFRDHD